MEKKNIRNNKRVRRSKRVSSKISRNRDKAQLLVYRSNKHVYGQILDIATGKTLLGVSSEKVEGDKDKKGKIDISFKTGELLAKKAKEQKVSEVIFNRRMFKYHGRVKAFADGARKGGLKF